MSDNGATANATSNYQTAAAPQGRAQAHTSSAAMRKQVSPLLSMRHIVKSYGGVHALRGASLTITQNGEVHALMGENGSGKSSLLKVLAGQVRPDGGQIELEGVRQAFSTSASALDAGIAMVAQETAVAPQLSIAENVLLGRRLVRSRGRINWRATYDRVEEIFERLDLRYDPRRLVGSLRPDERQMVEIARAMSMDAKILILDEPTSSLTEDEVDQLFSAVRRLKSDGVSIVFVSHRLSEVFALCDEVTVLRDGGTVATGPAQQYDVGSLVEAMVGPRPTSMKPSVHRQPTKEVVLSLRGLTSPGRFADVDLAIHRGEIVGIAGLVGAGRSELLADIFAGNRTVTGTVSSARRTAARCTPRTSITAGLGYVPPDRANGGLLLELSIRENTTIVRDSIRPRLAMPRRGAAARDVQPLMKSMRIRAQSAETVVRTLSGGNQQKVAVARWLAADIDVLLLDEPTRGVDVNAKREIHDLIRQCAADGLGLLVSSSEYDELIELCDRVFVMFRGRVVAELAHPDITESKLSRLAGGHQ